MFLQPKVSFCIDIFLGLPFLLMVSAAIPDVVSLASFSFSRRYSSHFLRLFLSFFFFRRKASVVTPPLSRGPRRRSFCADRQQPCVFFFCPASLFFFQLSPCCFVIRAVWYLAGPFQRSQENFPVFSFSPLILGILIPPLHFFWLSICSGDPPITIFGLTASLDCASWSARGSVASYLVWVFPLFSPWFTLFRKVRPS